MKSLGYQKTFMRIYPKVVTPECFYRGSTRLTTTLSSLSKGRGSSHGSAILTMIQFIEGSPVRLDSRYKHSGMTDETA